jgi:hypothetical protein
VRTAFVILAMGLLLPMPAGSSQPVQRQFDGLWIHCSRYQGDDVCSYTMLVQHDDRLCGLWGYWASGKVYEGRLRGKVTANIAHVEEICGTPGSETSVDCAREQDAQQIWQRSDKMMFVCKGRLYESNVGFPASCTGTSNAASLTKATGRMQSKVMVDREDKAWLEACVKSSGVD